MNIHLRKGAKSDTWELINCANRPLIKANKFLSTLRTRGLSPHSIRAYGYDLVSLYRWLKKRKKSITTLQLPDLLHFIDAAREGGAQPRSINRRLITIRSFYQFCMGTSLAGGKGMSLPVNHYRGRGRDRYLGLHRISMPKHRLLQVKVPRTLVEPLTVEQVRLFLHSLSRYRDLCIVYFMLLCGLRSQEVIELKERDISLQEQRVRIHGKGNKERMIPLPDALAAAIGNYRQYERPHNCVSTTLFVILQGKQRGNSMTPAGLRSIFRHRRQEPALSNANAHRWRHTFGADMARAGTTLPVLQRLMGHSDPRVTLQYVNLSMTDIAAEFIRATEEIDKRYKQRKSLRGYLLK